MHQFIVPARPVARGIVAVATTSIAALMISSAVAQQAPANQRPTAQTPRSAQAQQKPPAATPAQPAQPAQPSGAAAQMPQLIYSQWVKFCVAPGEGNGAAPAPADPKDTASKGKQVCLTGIDGRMESGMPIVAVVAIEPPAEAQNAKKILRITLPIGMQLQHGTRVIVDQSQPLTAPYVTCFTNGCISDYELTADTLTKIKKGKSAVVQGINYNGSAISVPVPLTEFAKAFDGPPTDPKILEERQKKLEEELKKKGEELQKKANEARQRLEQSGNKPQ
jgi:invasion protein IalB